MATGVCAIEPTWIHQAAPSLCEMTPPLCTPPPAYDAIQDVVLCHRGVSFGCGSWALPPLQAPLPVNPPTGVPSREAVFGAALLDGHIGGPTWKALATHLAAPSSSLMTVAGMAQARCVELLHVLTTRGVVSRGTLCRVWAAEPAFLRREVGLWVRKDARETVLRGWPRLVEEVVAAKSGVVTKKKKKTGLEVSRKKKRL